MSDTMGSTPYETTVLHVRQYGSAMGYMVWRCGNDCTQVVEGASMVPLWSTQRYVGEGNAPFRSRSGLYPTMSQDTGVSESTLDTYFGLGDLLVNQLGMDHYAFLGLINGRWFFFANPVIVRASKETTTGIEGCLSIPKAQYEVARHDWVEMDYEDEYGHSCSGKFEGFNAVVIQHEIDHLNGVLILDKGTETK